MLEVIDLPEGVGQRKVVGVRDIYLASYLMLMDKTFMGVKRDNGGFQSAFYFEGVTEEDVRAYYYTPNQHKQLFECFKTMRNFSTHMELDKD